MSAELQERVAYELALAFEAAGVRHAFIHGLERFPAFTSRDLDLLVPSDQIENAVAAAERHFRSSGHRFVSHRRINGSCWCFVAASAGRTVCEFDLVPRLRWGPAILADEPRALSRIGPFRVDPWAGFVKRVLVQLLGGNIAKLSRRHEELALSDSERLHVPAVLSAYVGVTLAEMTMSAIDERDLNRLRNLIPRLRRSVVARCVTRRPRRLLAATVDWARNELAASPIARPIVPLLAVVGVDGVGKSTLVEHVRVQLRERLPVLDVQTRHWRPSLIPPLKQVVRGRFTADPSPAQPPRRSPGRGQLLRLAYYGVDFCIGGWWRDRRASAGLVAVVYDRCLLDMLVDPVRFGLTSTAGVRCIRRIAPAPDVVVLLHDDPDEIHARKGELDVREIARQQAEWLALAAAGEVHVVLSAREPVDVLAARVVDHVIDRFLGQSNPRGSASLVHAMDGVRGPTTGRGE